MHVARKVEEHRAGASDAARIVGSEAKLRENMERDERVNARLREMGWRVLRLWQHEVEGELEESVCRVRDFLRTG